MVMMFCTLNDQLIDVPQSELAQLRAQGLVRDLPAETQPAVDEYVPELAEVSHPVQEESVQGPETGEVPESVPEAPASN